MVISDQEGLGKPLSGWRLRLYTIIFEADTRAGRLFDQWLVGIILLSVAVVLVDSMQGVSPSRRTFFAVMEWIFTVAFTAEYVTRLLCVTLGDTPGVFTA